MMLEDYGPVKTISAQDVYKELMIKDEDLQDLEYMELYEEAIKEYRENPRTYTLEEVEKDLSL